MVYGETCGGGLPMRVFCKGVNTTHEGLVLAAEVQACLENSALHAITNLVYKPQPYQGCKTWMHCHANRCGAQLCVGASPCTCLFLVIDDHILQHRVDMAADCNGGHVGVRC